jgi:hypothetical protein
MPTAPKPVAYELDLSEMYMAMAILNMKTPMAKSNHFSV